MLQNNHISSLLAYLRQIRAPYLSTAPPPSTSKRRPSQPTQHLTDTDRDAIETSTATLLKDLDASITNLSNAEQLRISTQTTLLQKKYGKSGAGKLLYRWAAAGAETAKSREEEDETGRNEMLAGFREGVLWYLGARLEEATKRQMGMVEVRVRRAEEREKSVLYKMKQAPVKRQEYGNGGAGGMADGDGGESGNRRPTRGTHDTTLEEETAIREELSPEQLQLFEEENNVMLRHFEDELSKVQ